MHQPASTDTNHRLTLCLAGHGGEPETRRVDLVWSAAEGCWRTARPCVAVRSVATRTGRVHHRAFRCLPLDPAHPELGALPPQQLYGPSASDRRHPVYATRIPEIDASRRYVVFGWADSVARTGDPAHDDRDLGLPLPPPPARARDEVERMLRAPDVELAVAIAGGADPLASMAALLVGDPDRMTRLRGPLTHRFSWAIPSEPALAALVGLGPLIEIGAGTGYWAALLRARGADVLAFDIAPPGLGRTNDFHRRAALWTTVACGGPEKAALVGRERALLLVWPPYSHPMAARALAAYVGDRLAYIGEAPGGCTADDRFFEALEADWVIERTIGLGARWPGIADGLAIYHRR